MPHHLKYTFSGIHAKNPIILPIPFETVSPKPVQKFAFGLRGVEAR
jgi:hypothetical protein